MSTDEGGLDLDDTELRRLVRTPHWTSDLRARIVAADLDRELGALGMVDQSAAIGELIRLRTHHDLVLLARASSTELRQHLLDGYLRDHVSALLSCAQTITSPAPGLPGGWLLRSTTRTVIDPLTSQLPDDLSPPPDAATPFPLWRTEDAAAAALADLRARDWPQWPHSQHLMPDWTCVAHPVQRTQDGRVDPSIPDYRLIDDAFWADK